MSEIVALPQREWEDFETFVHGFRNDVHAGVKLISAYLVRMNHVQLAKAKKLMKGLFSAAQVDRIRLFGQGLIEREQVDLPISARVLRALPESKRKELMPEREVEIFTAQGVKLKPLGQLSATEVKQVVHPEVGILPAEKQARAAAGKVQAAPFNPDDYPDCEKVFPKDGYLYLEFKNGAKGRIAARMARPAL